MILQLRVFYNCHIALIERGQYSIKLFPGCPSHSQTHTDITRDVVQLLNSEFGFQPLGRLKSFPATSCEEIRQTHNTQGQGLFWIGLDGMEPTLQYCDI